MKQLPWRVFILVTILGLVLAACGTGGTNESEPAEESQDASEPATSEPAGSEPAETSDCGVDALGGEAVAVEFGLQRGGYGGAVWGAHGLFVQHDRAETADAAQLHPAGGRAGQTILGLDARF